MGREGGQVMSRLRARNCFSEEQVGNSWDSTELTPADRLKLLLGPATMAMSDIFLPVCFTNIDWFHENLQNIITFK